MRACTNTTDLIKNRKKSNCIAEKKKKRRKNVLRLQRARKKIGLNACRSRWPKEMLNVVSHEVRHYFFYTLVLERHSVFLIPNHMVWWFSYSFFYFFRVTWIRSNLNSVLFFCSVLFCHRIFSHFSGWKKRGIGFSYFAALFVCARSGFFLYFYSRCAASHNYICRNNSLSIERTFLPANERDGTVTFYTFFCGVKCCGERERFFFVLFQYENLTWADTHMVSLSHVCIKLTHQRDINDWKIQTLFFGCSLHYD